MGLPDDGHDGTHGAGAPAGGNMKEHIYTIPVTEAFEQEGECPLCFCQCKLEEDALEYELGAAMMEPDHRIGTNKSGFCTRHYEKLYNMQKNRLPFGLILDTHMEEQNRVIAQAYRKVGDKLAKESADGMLDAMKERLAGRKRTADLLTGELLGILAGLLDECAVCSSVGHTMKQFADTVIYLFFREPDFRLRMESGKGFCLPHLKLLLEIGDETLSVQKKAMWLRSLLPLQVENLERVQSEVHWFTQMFDHRNRDADWKNSKDAISRAVRKLGGPMDID
jgi:hypothetical protein